VKIRGLQTSSSKMAKWRSAETGNLSSSDLAWAQCQKSQVEFPLLVDILLICDYRLRCNLCRPIARLG